MFLHSANQFNFQRNFDNKKRLLSNLCSQNSFSRFYGGAFILLPDALNESHERKVDYMFLLLNYYIIEPMNIPINILINIIKTNLPKSTGKAHYFSGGMKGGGCNQPWHIHLWLPNSSNF